MVGLGLDSVTTAAILFIVTLGLLIVFGIMKIINFAHGAFLTIGAYTGVVTTSLGWSPWLTLALAPIAGFLIGLVIERIVIRPLYGRPLDTILGTWGLSLVLIQLLTLRFGRGVQAVVTTSMPPVHIFGTIYSSYRLLLIAVAVVMGLAVVVILRGTKLGLVGRAVIMDDELAQALGINIDLVRIVSFATGAALACLAGAIIAPLTSIDPNMGVGWLINAFMLSLLGGVSVPALAGATLVLGGAQVAVGYVLNGVVAGVTIVTLAVVILRIRPSGFSRE